MLLREKVSRFISVRGASKIFGQEPLPEPPKRDQSAPPRTQALRSVSFSLLNANDAMTIYYELAAAASSLPISPSFVIGPFPEFLTEAYFLDLTALPVGCYTLRNIGVTSHNLLVRNGTLLTSDQLGLSEGSVTEASLYGIICVKDGLSRKIDGTVVSIAGPGHLIYGHWLVDFLPRLFLLYLSGIDPLEVEYLLPSNTPRFALNWLELLGINPQHLLFFEPYSERVAVSCLIVPTLLRTNGRAHPLFRSAIEYLLTLLSRKGEHVRGEGSAKRLFLSRGGSGRENRKLLNRQVIERIAAEAGYAVVRPEALSIAEQLTLFVSAKTIVGEYGSALHGSVFAPPGTVVCALRASARHPGFLQSGLCQVMAQKIGYVFASAGEKDIEQEFAVPEDNFRAALTLIGICETD